MSGGNPRLALPRLACRVISAYRAQLSKEDLARMEAQFADLDRRLGVVRPGPAARDDDLEELWRLRR